MDHRDFRILGLAGSLRQARILRTLESMLAASAPPSVTSRTEAGELLLEEARRIFVQVDQTVSVIQRVGHGEVGRLTLGFVPSASNEVLPSKEGPTPFRAPTSGKECRFLLVAPGQVQRPEIDVGFVGLGPAQGTTAVSAKPPGVRIGAGATWESHQFDRIHPCRLDEPPCGDDE